MITPGIGPLSDPSRTGLCSYGQPDGRPLCAADATWHGIATDGKGLESCDEHKPVMVSLVVYVHAMEPACALPDSVFVEDENRCELPWDPTDLLISAEAELVPVG